MRARPGIAGSEYAGGEVCCRCVGEGRRAVPGGSVRGRAIATARCRLRHVRAARRLARVAGVASGCGDGSIVSEDPIEFRSIGDPRHRQRQCRELGEDVAARPSDCSGSSSRSSLAVGTCQFVGVHDRGSRRRRGRRGCVQRSRSRELERNQQVRGLDRQRDRSLDPGRRHLRVASRNFANAELARRSRLVSPRPRCASAIAPSDQQAGIRSGPRVTRVLLTAVEGELAAPEPAAKATSAAGPLVNGERTRPVASNATNASSQVAGRACAPGTTKRRRSLPITKNAIQSTSPGDAAVRPRARRGRCARSRHEGREAAAEARRDPDLARRCGSAGRLERGTDPARTMNRRAHGRRPSSTLGRPDLACGPRSSTASEMPAPRTWGVRSRSGFGSHVEVDECRPRPERRTSRAQGSVSALHCRFSHDARQIAEGRAEARRDEAGPRAVDSRGTVAPNATSDDCASAQTSAARCLDSASHAQPAARQIATNSLAKLRLPSVLTGLGVSA